MNHYAARLRLLPVALLMLAVTGCFWELTAWSPDGRYVAFVDKESGELWRWDTQMENAERLNLNTEQFIGDSTVREKVIGCRYLPSGDKMLVLTDHQNKGETADLYLRNAANSSCRRVASNVAITFDMTATGKVYFIENSRTSDTFTIRSFQEGEQDTPVVLSGRGECGFVRADPADRRLLVTFGDRLALAERDSGTTRTVVQSKGHDDRFYWPLWIDKDRFLYFFHDGETKLGDLQVYSFDRGTTQSLCGDVSVGPPPVLSPDRRTVVLTVNPGRDKDKIYSGHLAAIDLETGRRTDLTSAPASVGWPAFSADGKRLAYWLADADQFLCLAIRDMQSGVTSLAWRNDQEKLFALALSFEQAGEPTKALALLDDLQTRFPESPLREIAFHEMLRLNLQAPRLDVDKAFDALQQLSSAEWKENAWQLIWRSEDRLAIDSAEDWITTYTTPQAEQEYGFNTDLTRDLRGFWGRAGKQRLYLRVDYGSDRDLTGIAFQDTLILIGDRARRGGSERISPSVAWDRKASRSILLRDWYPSVEQSHYDVEIRSKPGADASIQAQGVPITTPWIEIQTVGGSDSLLIVIDRKYLDLTKAAPLEFQVCTFKGGADDVKKLELPRRNRDGARAVCDVADAFGAENTAARLHAARAEQGAQPGAPLVIRGIAGTLDLPAMEP